MAWSPRTTVRGPQGDPGASVSVDPDDSDALIIEFPTINSTPIDEAVSDLLEDEASATSVRLDSTFLPRSEYVPGGGGGVTALAPEDLSFKAWVCDPGLLTVGTRSTPIAGRLDGTLFRLPTTTITGVSFYVGVAGVTVTNCYIGIINAVSGERLAVTANLSTTVTSTGLKRVPFEAPVDVTEGLAYVVLLVGSAGTMPQVTRLSNTDSGFLNARGPGQVVGRARSRTIGSSSTLTSIPESNNMAVGGATSVGLWAAID